MTLTVMRTTILPPLALSLHGSNPVPLALDQLFHRPAMADTNASAPPAGLAASVARALHELTSESPDVGALELLDDLHRLAAQAADMRL